jgi:hypothetical protein
MNTQVEKEATKRQIAKHFLLDAKGAVVEEFEQAAGIRYVDLESGGTFDYVPKSEDAKMMLMCFGARTLSTNEASAARQKDASGAEQLAAIKSRFDLIESGTWVDRTRDAVSWDHPTLATAAVNVLVASGKIADDEAAKGAKYANALKLLTEKGDAGIAALRAVAGVETEYRKLKGRGPVKTADDLVGLLG